MTTVLGHEELAELLGAYALDAVDGDERDQIEAHLPQCPRCRAEVEGHQEVAARLAFAGATAPEGVWSRIAAELEPAELEPDLARLYPLHPPRTRRRWLVATLAAAAAAVVMVIGALGWELRSQQRKMTSLTTALAAKVGLSQAARDASLDPKSTKFTLTSVDGKIHVDAVVQPDGTGFLIPHASLPRLAADQTYELWGVLGGQRLSLGLLGPKPDVVAFRVAAPRMDALAITTERAAGVTQTTKVPVAAGWVPTRPATDRPD